MGTIIYPCGCSVTSRMGGGGLNHPVGKSLPPGTPIEGIRTCIEHGNFSTVQAAWRLLRTALDEAHERLPSGPLPEPPKSAA